jgi:hypothetical protein
MARTPFTAEWVQAGSGIFQWGRQAAYWKAAKGWWASRKGHEGIQGPFRTAAAAQRWAEEPFREAHRAKALALRAEARRVEEGRTAKREAQKARVAERLRLGEEQELNTWNGLPPEARKVQAGQVWALRNPKHASHQVLVVEVKKTLAIVLARDSRATPWKGLALEPRTLGHLPKLYRLVGAAKIPAGAR